MYEQANLPSILLVLFSILCRGVNFILAMDHIFLIGESNVRNS